MAARSFLATAAICGVVILGFAFTRGDTNRRAPAPRPSAGTPTAVVPSASTAALDRTAGGVYPCDPPAREVTADLLGVDTSDLYPGERYPSTGTCVFWTRVHPGDFGIVQLDGLDSHPPSWPCGPDQLTEQERADVNGTPARVRACTAP